MEFGLSRYRMRLKRRRFLVRAFRKRHELLAVSNRVNADSPGILLFCTVRNEIERLPYFLKHYRGLGVQHFVFVVNSSTDGTLDFLTSQTDTSVWETKASYKASRFGMDWITWLQFRFAHKRWTITVDADELLVYAHHDQRPLDALTHWLDHIGLKAFPAMMLDLYPKGPVGAKKYQSKQNPTEILDWFDAGNYSLQIQKPLGNLWIQGGPRARNFFKDDPRRAPTLNKIPLVKWNRRFAYVNSTHSALPPKLNAVFDTNGGERPSGVLLHTKFLDSIVAKSKEEMDRKEHFNKSEQYDDYYEALTQNPDLWCEHSTQLKGWKQLRDLGLLSDGGWA